MRQLENAQMNLLQYQFLNYVFAHVTFLWPPHRESAPYQVLEAIGFVNVEK